MIFDVFYGKQAFLNNKNIGFKNPQNWHFCKGVSSWFWSKIWNFVNVSFYAKYTQRKYFGDVLVNKQAFLDTINMDFKRGQNWHFCKVQDFGKKVEVF